MLQKRSAQGCGCFCKAFGKFEALGFNESIMVKAFGGGALVCRTEE